MFIARQTYRKKIPQAMTPHGLPAFDAHVASAKPLSLLGNDQEGSSPFLILFTDDILIKRLRFRCALPRCPTPRTRAANAPLRVPVPSHFLMAMCSQIP